MGIYLPTDEPLMPRCVRCGRGISTRPEGAQVRRGSRSQCRACIKKAQQHEGEPRRQAGITGGPDEFAGAVCHQVDGEMWWAFPSSTDYADAKRLCYSCPVRRACAARALALGEQWGIWAGFDMHNDAERDACRQWARTSEAVSV